MFSIDLVFFIWFLVLFFTWFFIWFLYMYSFPNVPLMMGGEPGGSGDLWIWGSGDLGILGSGDLEVWGSGESQRARELES